MWFVSGDLVLLAVAGLFVPVLGELCAEDSLTSEPRDPRLDCIANESPVCQNGLR